MHLTCRSLSLEPPTETAFIKWYAGAGVCGAAGLSVARALRGELALRLLAAPAAADKKPD